MTNRTITISTPTTVHPTARSKSLLLEFTGFGKDGVDEDDSVDKVNCIGSCSDVVDKKNCCVDVTVTVTVAVLTCSVEVTITVVGSTVCCVHIVGSIVSCMTKVGSLRCSVTGEVADMLSTRIIRSADSFFTSGGIITNGLTVVRFKSSTAPGPVSTTSNNEEKYLK